MKLPDNIYQALKWIALIAIPAAAVLYCTLAGVWGWPFADEISRTANAVCVFIGAIIGISSANYNKIK